MPDNRIKLQPNVPVTLKLVDPFADSSERYDPELRICEYRTECNRILALPRQASIDLNNLDVQPGEQVTVCRYTAEQGNVTGTMRPHIQVWLSTSSEKARAATEVALESSNAPSDEELLLEASLKREDAKKRRNGHPTPIRKEPAPADSPIQPRLFDRGTGTHGPAPQQAPAAQARPAIATKTPYGRMLRHIIHTVEAALKAEGVQLGDAPKQDLYSTVYIDAAKRSGIEYDFTRGVE